MKQERWVFTVEELAVLDCGRQPDVSGDDEFIAYPVPQAPQHGVIVQRNGQVTNRYADGTVGVPEDQQEMANDCESLWTSTDQDGLADEWRDVLVEDTGEFVRFVNEGPPIAGYWVIALVPGGEEMHWGKDGNTLLPYTTKAEAADQCDYLRSEPETQTREEDRLYIVTIFANGQMLWEEYE